MTVMMWLSGALALFMLVYLFYVLIKPENF